jgi:Zn-dependent peptidase ImmA (M78 family)
MIKIGKYKYKIQDIDNMDSEELTVGGIKCYGTTDYLKQMIYMWSNATKERYNSTLRHELSHATLESYGLSKESYTEEEVCDIIANYGEDIVDEARKWKR